MTANTIFLSPNIIEAIIHIEEIIHIKSAAPGIALPDTALFCKKSLFFLVIFT